MVEGARVERGFPFERRLPPPEAAARAILRLFFGLTLQASQNHTPSGATSSPIHPRWNWKQTTSANSPITPARPTNKRQHSPTRARTRCHHTQPCLHSCPPDTSSTNARRQPRHHHQRHQRRPSACRYQRQHQHQQLRHRCRRHCPHRHQGPSGQPHGPPASARWACRDPRVAGARDQTSSRGYR